MALAYLHSVVVKRPSFSIIRSTSSPLAVLQNHMGQGLNMNVTTTAGNCANTDFIVSSYFLVFHMLIICTTTAKLSLLYYQASGSNILTPSLNLVRQLTLLVIFFQCFQTSKPVGYAAIWQDYRLAHY